MKKNLDKIIFTAACLVICVIPFVGMTVAKTDTTTENREMAELPELISDGKLNTSYLSDLGDYFEDHFAFRNQLVTVDSLIMCDVFKTSNMDTVITGTDGWLYYTATLDDYTNDNTISDREAFNIVNNISIMQDYVTSTGADFVFTIAPNKNTLYGDNMPYYYRITEDDTNNIDLVAPLIAKSDINYADLFEAFSAQDEVLYLKRDSHWNEKGAVLAYNTILDALEYEHDDFSTTASTRTKTECGDLNSMLYPLWNELEWNYTYDYEATYTYTTDTASVEDAWITTSNTEKDASLLMFRDSFGNTLLPLMANEFGDSCFSKSVPYQLERYINSYEPDSIIVEKVERNISDFAEEPPVMTGPKLTEEIDYASVDTDTSVLIEKSENDSSYTTISGIVDEDVMSSDTRIFVKVNISGDIENIYEAFTVSTDESDNGYLLYLLDENGIYEEASVEIITYTNGKYTLVASN